MSDVFVAIILGLIEGITEFLPVSSTGHLIVAGHFLGFVGKNADTFEIFIQLGAILAVVYLYWNRFAAFLDFKSADGFAGRVGIQKLLLGCVPALASGFLLHSFIKSHLFSPDVVAISLILGGIVLLVIKDKGDQPIKSIDQITYRQSFIIGCFQILSLCPGVSRSGSTIVGALLTGCRRSVAAEFSFLLAVPTMCAAVGYDMLKSYSQLTVHDLPTFLIGFFVSFITAILAVKAFVAFLNRASLKPFGVYRIILGIVVLVLL